MLVFLAYILEKIFMFFIAFINSSTVSSVKFGYLLFKILKLIIFSSKVNFIISVNLLGTRTLFFSSTKNKVFLKNNSLVIHCTEFKLAKKNLVEWLKLEAKKYLVNRVQFVSSKIRINFKSLNLKGYRTMWGCCNSRSEICLNWKLVMLPKKVIDYVIVHELCHIVEPNHSKSFWSLVKQHDSEYIENKNWLKKNGIEVIKF